MKQLFTIIFLITTSISIFAGNYETKVKVLPLKSLDYKTVNIFCRPMLSKDGAMAYLKDRRAILVNDKPSVIAKIANFIEQAGTERHNIRITIDYVGSSEKEQQEFGIKSKSWGLVVDHGKVKLPKVNGITITKKSSSSIDNKQMQLVTVSGSAASLWVGKEVPEVSSVRNYLLHPKVKLRRRGKLIVLKSVDFEMRQVGAKLKIRPILQADGFITVELFPEVSYFTKEGKRETLQIETLTTTVTVIPGHKVSIGGVVSKKKDGYTNLFGPDFFKSEDGQKILKMFVTAQVL